MDADSESFGHATSKVKPRATQPLGTSNFVLGDRFLADTTSAVSRSGAGSAIMITARSSTARRHFNSLGCPVGCQATPVEAGAQRGHQLGHVPNQIIVDFCVIDYHHGATFGVKDSGNVSSPTPGEAIPMFDDDHGHRRVREES